MCTPEWGRAQPSSCRFSRRAAESYWRSLRGGPHTMTGSVTSSIELERVAPEEELAMERLVAGAVM